MSQVTTLERVNTHNSESFALKPINSVGNDPGQHTAASSAVQPISETGTTIERRGETDTAPPASTPEEADPEFPVMPKWQLQLTFVSLAVVGFLANLDTSIVATAMPTIASEFDSLNQQSWIALSYLLTNTVFQPMWGRATDLIGSRTILFVCVFTFELGSLLCALSKNFIWLCCARAIAGLGAGGITIVIMVILTQMVSIRERGNYIGIFAARIVIAMILGPLLGGLFVSFDWRWCFWINLVISVPALAILVAFIKKLPNRTKPDIAWRDIDYGGLVILGVCVTAICLAFNWGGIVYEWNSAVIIALLVVGFALVLVFVIYEIKVPKLPLIPMKMFRFRNVTTTTVNNFFTAAAMLGVFIYLPSYYQLVRHDKQVISGLEVLPYIMPLLLTSTLSGLIVARTGYVQGVLWVGGIGNLLGTGLLILLNGRYPRAVEYVLLVLTGLGSGFLMQSTILSAQSQVPRDILATVTTMSLWSRSMGGVISIAMQGSIITNLFKRSLLETPAALPYINQLLAASNVESLPPEVQVIAAQSYGSAFQMMMVATTVFCTPGFIASLATKKEKLS
ncbi:MFS general substrate transporter [Dacryopinax primogenitus]|uniref:MFS-type drug efflux transporter P55 n=1 Tax=Dacryopinax primogenitus (strain DJM 731) TaxID=1858805 RepID=M5G8R8_DACPD|nr:MFS general substrate transporter [Dacryopinax primogenitus]EJU02242.1 MFS general substrate transporter [Dacryopinax primogenitus]